MEMRAGMSGFVICCRFIIRFVIVSTTFYGDYTLIHYFFSIFLTRSVSYFAFCIMNMSKLPSATN